MAKAKLKTEMKGTTSRWMRRAEAKDAANHRRRVADKEETDYETEDENDSGTSD